MSTSTVLPKSQSATVYLVDDPKQGIETIYPRHTDSKQRTATSIPSEGLKIDKTSILITVQQASTHNTCHIEHNKKIFTS